MALAQQVRVVWAVEQGRNGRMLRETIQGRTIYWRYYRQGRSRRRRCFAIHEVRLSTDLLVDMFT